MSDSVINIPRESTMQEIRDILQEQAAGGARAQARDADIRYKNLVNNATSKEEVDELFIEWWKSQYDADKYTKSQMLERWFGNVLDDARVHGDCSPLYATSASSIGEATDDSVGLSCTPSTASAAGVDDFAKLPQFWCLEASAEKNEDGTHTIYAVEHIDDTADVRSGEHLCWVLQKNTYIKEYDEDGYRYLKMRCHPAPGYKRWREGTDKAGKVYAYMAHPKYYAGLDAAGTITCGTGLAPVNWTSHAGGVTKWRARGAQYSGGSGALVKFLNRMMRLKYHRKGNSGTIEGCSSYNCQYTAAVSETGVERVVLTQEQAANLLVGSSVQLGIQDGNDRSTASNYSICHDKLITRIEDVEIDGTAYSAVYIDNGGTAFDTEAGSTLLSTDPYWSGWNDDVLGNDGSRYSPTSGKEPGLLQKVEFMNGSYLIISDELWQWSQDDEENYLLDCYVCDDQAKVSGTAITDDYVKQDALTLKFPSTQASGWMFIEDTVISDIEWPLGVGSSGTGRGLKAGFYYFPVASGLRASWCFGALIYGSISGVACRSSNALLKNVNWFGALGAPGLNG